MPQVTTTQVRKWFHNLNMCGDKYRANIAHAAIRMLQSGKYSEAIALLQSIGYPFQRETPARLKPRLDSIYAVSAIDAKAYNANHVSQITGIERATIWGQSNWRMETTGARGKVVRGTFQRAIDSDSLDVAKRSQFDVATTLVTRDATDNLRVKTDVIPGKQPVKPRRMLVSIETVITRARHLMDTAHLAKNPGTQLRRAQRMLDYAATVLPMRETARERFAETLQAMTRMQAAIETRDKLRHATVYREPVCQSEEPTIKLVSIQR